MTERREAVLVVDGDDQRRAATGGVLRDSGLVPSEATTGKQALDRARSAAPAVVVIGTSLPDMIASELARQLKLAAPGTLVLQLLPDSPASDKAPRVGPAGADLVLPESSPADSLKAALQTLLRLYRSERNLRQAFGSPAQREGDGGSGQGEVGEILLHGQKLEALGQLAGGIAHDFNNLLTIILGNMESLNRQIDRGNWDVARVRALADSAFNAAQRALGVTKRLIAFSRRQALDPKPINVNTLVTTMSDLFRRSLGESIQVETSLSERLWRTEVDLNQLESALLNLALNGRDAMPEGGKLLIETANLSLGGDPRAAENAGIPLGDYVMLSVTDSGAGMRDEILSQAFHPFFTTKEVGQGSGLGLPQVYGFVRQSGGQVRIYSEVGRGTTVKIYLPRFVADLDAAEAVQPNQEPAGVPGKSVLVVEDEAGVRDHSVEILEELGYRVVSAPDAKSALAILERDKRIDLLFTDVGLPGGMSGKQLGQEAQRRLPGLKVLLTSGYSEAPAKSAGGEAGHALLAKPFTFSDLARAVRGLLEGPSAPGPCVLVVEDEPLLRMATIDSLETLGFRVEEAASATEALLKVRDAGNSITAAIIDIGLPDRKGDALAAELRALHADLPMLFSTGYSEDALRHRFAQDRKMAFLGKPYFAADLEAALRSLGVDVPLGQ